MNIGLPLPHFESEGLEDSYRQHHKSAADEADADGFFMTFVHTAGKGTNKWAENQKNFEFSRARVLSTKSKVRKRNEKWIVKREKFASARHFMLISSHFIARLSQTYAEYPRYLEG